ncbi:MAG: hypothetical protein QY330_04420 [Candidatus Dojkabacteria bacterium]|uniref:Uncharacterized protein n=1 Tax=Candidatus Dojkabacteria bacterium TaxID=2099670 RepID=A0A952DW44_9BACT|nr:hypothetical protein [Candidatus Dojkabacteria bacterium]WKZ27766.1 MAG: hypothetical protein QY330_04420 [Candidatus Dojkabacteria bacterium]
MEGFVVSLVVSAITGFVVAFIVRSTQLTKNMTPEEKKRKTGGFDVEVDL